MALASIVGMLGTLPPVGLGLWKAPKGEVGDAVKEALRAGYRLLDGAAAYANEAEVGEAIKESIEAGVVSRSELTVVSKLFNTHHVWNGDTSRPEVALRKTLADLQLEKLDVYLMHWPFAFEQTDLGAIGGLRGPDGTPNPKLVYEIEFVETYKAMVALKKLGLCERLGVCNLTVEQLEQLIAACPDDAPEILQVELHPYLAQPELAAFCREKRIEIMAYSPLGSADSYSGKSFPAAGTGAFECPEGGAPLLGNACVARVAERRRIPPAQVLLAWSRANGFVPLPKSVNAERIRQNLAAAEISLEREDLDELAGLDCGFRYGIGYCKGHYDCPNAPWSR